MDSVKPPKIAKGSVVQVVPKGGRPRGRPRLEDVALIESELLDIALKEFLHNGYGGTSMTRIVKAAGISKTTIYSRFDSKEQLFRAIMAQQMERAHISTLLRYKAGSVGLEQGLKSYANRTLEISLKGGMLGVNRLIYSESHRFPELGIAAAERTQVGVQQIADFIRDCAAGDGMPCADPERVAEVFILLLRGWYVNQMLTNRTVPAAMREAWVDRAVYTLMASRAEW